MAGTRVFVRAGACVIGLAVILAACTAPGRPVTAAGSPVPGPPVADGGANVLLTPGGTAWTTTGDEVLRSADGGATWHAVTPVKTDCGCLGPVYFLGATDAWGLAERNIPYTSQFAARVWLTTSGGHRWTKGGSLPGEPSLDNADTSKQMDFADPRHGWILGYGVPVVPASPGATPRLEVVLWRTGNGGLTWRMTGSGGLPEAGRAARAFGGPGSCGSQDSLGLTFISATAGWLTGDGCGGSTPQAWATGDGGEHWRRITVPPPPGGWPAGGTADTEAPVFTTTMDGLLPVSTGPGRLLIYRTQDAGQRWTLASQVVTGSLERPAGLIVLSPFRWLLPVSDGLLTTGTAGRRWQLVGSGVDLPDLAGLSMLPDGTGIAEGGQPYPFAAYRTTSGGRSWSPVGRSADGTGGKAALVYGIDMTGRNRGFAYGLAGIKATSDGGRRWTSVAKSVGAISGLAFGSRRSGIAVAADSVLTTSDGGARWNPGGEPTAGPLNWVQALSGSVAVGAVCETPDAWAFERTTDGGLSWQQVRLPGGAAGGTATGGTGGGVTGRAALNGGDVTGGACGAPSGRSVCFATPRAGFYVAPAKGRLEAYRTSDAGRRWEAAAGPLPRETSGLSACGRGRLWAVALEPDSGMSEQAYAVFRSRDGGRSWRQVLAPLTAQRAPLAGTGRPGSITTAPGTGLAALDVVSPLTAWVVGSCEACGDGLLTVIRTEDGGQTWLTPGGAPATQPGGSGAQSGGASATQAGVASATQAGVVPGLATLSAASFRSATTGWLLGWPAAQRGPTVLLATHDGGASWQRIAVFGRP